MVKKTSDQDDSKPVDYFKEVEAAKKQDKSTADGLINSLRSDMLLTSSAAPARKNIFQRINLKYLFGILLTIFIIVFIWFWLTGPGRPILEHNLVLLVGAKATPTQTDVLTGGLATATSPQPSETAFPSPTIKPSITPTTRVVVSPTIALVKATPTPLSACRDVLTITLADVGQTLCVQGTIMQTVESPNAFMVIFSSKPGSPYWVAYDLVWSKAEPNKCYQTTGKIEQLGNSPILIFNYTNLPELCP